MPKMTFINPDGTRLEVEAPVGLSVLEIAHRNNISLEGACEGSLACSTCCLVKPRAVSMSKLTSSSSAGVKPSTAVQLHAMRFMVMHKMTEELDGLTVSLPTATRNMMVDK